MSAVDLGEPLPVVDLGEPLPVVDLGEPVDPLAPTERPPPRVVLPASVAHPAQMFTPTFALATDPSPKDSP